jgi:hypothetical protein
LSRLLEATSDWATQTTRERKRTNSDRERRGIGLSGLGIAHSEDVAEQLVRYLLFTAEAPLEGPVVGTSGFADKEVLREGLHRTEHTEHGVAQWM